jgi:hypothetical protein
MFSSSSVNTAAMPVKGTCCPQQSGSVVWTSGPQLFQALVLDFLLRLTLRLDDCISNSSLKTVRIKSITFNLQFCAPAFGNH